MKAQWLSSTEEMEQFRAEWTALWDSCPRATPFQSPEWLIPWSRHVFAGGDIRVGTIYEEARLVGLAPFFVYGTDGRFLAFLGAGISDYGDVIALPGYERRCAEEALAAFGPEVAFDLTEIPVWSGMLTGKEERCSVCPVLKLPARDDLVDGIIDPKLRIDLRRARNRLEKQHKFEFTALPVEAGMPELFRLHAARWAMSGEPGVIKGLENFHCDTARQLAARGLLRLYGLRVDGVVAAIIYGFAAKGRFYSYLGGFDPSFARLSCGALLMRFAIGESIREGLTEFDFLRNPEAYKYAWGASDEPTYRVKT